VEDQHQLETWNWFICFTTGKSKCGNTLDSVTAHDSYSSSNESNLLFQRMFPTATLRRNSVVVRPKSHDLTYIAKSNSLRRAAKDKDAELKSVSDQLEAACLQLQNC